MRLGAPSESWLVARYPVASRVIQAQCALHERSRRARLRGAVVVGLLVVLVGLKPPGRDLGEDPRHACETVTSGIAANSPERPFYTILLGSRVERIHLSLGVGVACILPREQIGQLVALPIPAHSSPGEQLACRLGQQPTVFPPKTPRDDAELLCGLGLLDLEDA